MDICGFMTNWMRKFTRRRTPIAEDMERAAAVNQIEGHLYLGNADVAEDVATLKRLDIKYVLSVWNDEHKTKSIDIIYKKIDVDDTANTDLISHFAEANDFISGAVNAGHNVLVHCHAGVSRSATIVLAYLMQKHNWTVVEARDAVWLQRDIYPNPGFMRQLKIYEQMRYKFDAKNRAFRRVLVDTLLALEPRWTSRPVNDIDLYYTRRNRFEEMTEDFDAGADCLCVDCGFKLFSKIHVIENETKTEPKAECDDTEPGHSCQWTYVEPQEWMTRRSDGFTALNDRVVKCPKCLKQVVFHKRYLLSYSCGCDRHKSLNASLRFRIANDNFKVQE